MKSGVASNALKRVAMCCVLGLATLAASCPWDNSATEPNGFDVVGEYTLQSVNGDPVPSLVGVGEDTYTISAGSATIDDDHTFAYMETVDGVVNITVGTWSQSGGTYTFNPTESPGADEVPNGTATITAGGLMTLTVLQSIDLTVVRRLQKN